MWGLNFLGAYRRSLGTTPRRGVRGACPPYDCRHGGSRGGRRQFFGAPPWRGIGGSAPEAKIVCFFVVYFCPKRVILYSKEERDCIVLYKGFLPAL